MKAKKILGILLSLAMAVTAFAAFTVNASAESIEDKAKNVISGKTYSTTLEYKYIYGTDPVNYKIEATSSGLLEINFVSRSSIMYLEVYDNNGSKVNEESYSASTGEIKNGCKWNTKMEKCVGKITYKLKKGTYYACFWRPSDLSAKYGNGKLSVKFSFPSSSDSSNVKINNLTLTMKVGDKIQLGTALSASTEDNVAWKSSKTSVAKVSATGLVTAKAAGTATITATIGDSSQKIDIIVKK